MEKQYLGYTLANEEKLNRAVYGHMIQEGKLEGGVGEGATPEAVLAEYDKLGGLILKGNHKVKTGSFYDFPARKPKATPEVLLVFRDLDDNIIEIPEGEALPMEVVAAERIKEKKGAKKVIKIAKKVVKKADDEE